MQVGERPVENEPPQILNKRTSALKIDTPLLLTLAAGLICYGMFFNRGLGLSVIGYSIAPSERVMQGEVPYRDFLFNYTPGILWVNAALMKVFGATLMTTRIGLFVFKLITLLMLYVIARKLTNVWAGLVPVVLTLAWPGYQQVFNVYPDQYLILFALVGLFFMLKYNETSSGRWLLLFGVSTGTVFLFKYNVGVLLLGLGGLAIAVRELIISRRRTIAVRAVALYAFGFAIIGAALVGYLTYNHALGAMVGHFLHHAAEYSEARSVGLPSPESIYPAVIVLLPLLIVGVPVLVFARRAFVLYWIAAMIFVAFSVFNSDQGKVYNEATLALVAYFPPVVFVGTALAAVLKAVLELKKHEGSLAAWWNRNGALAITGFVALAVYLEVFPRADYFHLVRVLPPVFLFSCVLAYRCAPILTDQLSVRRLLSTPAAVLALSTPFVFLTIDGIRHSWMPQFESGLHFRDKHELAIDRGRGILVEDRQAELTEGLVKLIQANSSKDDYIFSFAQRGSAFYFLADRRNPSRFLWWRSVGISSEERDAVMTMIANRRAKLIIVQDVAANKEIQDFIGGNYDPVGTVADIAVYGLRTQTTDATNSHAPAN